MNSKNAAAIMENFGKVEELENPIVKGENKIKCQGSYPNWMQDIRKEYSKIMD